MFLGFPFKFFFFFILFMGSLMSLSSSHWMGMWMGLELNLMSFIPLLMTISSVEEVESSIKYFLVQALGSSFFLWGGFWLYSFGTVFNFFSMHLLCSFIFLCGLMLKLGCFPFHFWIPSVMSSLSWIGCMLLSTWQKFAPLFIFFWSFFDYWFYMVLFLSIFSSLVGGMGGINQVQIRILMAYSSINHLGWMLAAAMFSFFCLSMYYSIYFLISFFTFFFFSFMNCGRVSQFFSIFMDKFFLFFILFSLLCLSGMPPFVGFYSKWVVFQELSLYNHFFSLFMLVMGSIFSLYFYLNLFFSVFLIKFTSLSFGDSMFPSFMYLFSIVGVIFFIFGLGGFEIFYMFY